MITALCSVRITQWVEIISEREEYFRLNEYAFSRVFFFCYKTNYSKDGSVEETLVYTFSPYSKFEFFRQ